ncbi:MAG: AGE family epimerase/isomerase [Chloroflexota bacterium]
MPNLNFTFSDLLSGYVVESNADNQTFVLETPGKEQYTVRLTSTTFAKIVQNLGEGYQDATGQIVSMLQPGRFLFAYGVFYPDGPNNTYAFEAKEMVFLGKKLDEYRFEEPDWWVQQITQLADFYIQSEFGDSKIDYRNYRTDLSITGQRQPDGRQETDTISRLVYGMASAYMMTGNERYLEAAEKGTQYLRDHMRFYDEEKDVCYWYHAVDILEDKTERKIFASDFDDDKQAIPCYEQIYALAGPTQTYRINGNPAIRQDIDATIRLFEEYFKDQSEYGGYFSHLDPITLRADAESLGDNRLKKNWNSIGDHCPAYMINLWLATKDSRYSQFLEEELDMVVEHFPDYDHSAYVQERFFQDWSKDQTWKWQQNRAVMGHNYKISWNLMRMYGLKDKQSYLDFAEKIAAVMVDAGLDPQRCGLYDVREREIQPGENIQRFTWHDRKAWWQQEQVILAYLILNGILGKEEYQKHARESAAFYNAWFLDTISGGVYFNVLANGRPYSLGTERWKGSHSMAGYHSFELSYLAMVYTNLLIREEPIQLFFKPAPGGFADNILRVEPDILPPDRTYLSAVWINDEPYTDFDGQAMTVNLPSHVGDITVRVQVAPASRTFTTNLLGEEEGMPKIALIGALTNDNTSILQQDLDRVLNKTNAKGLWLTMNQLTSLSEEAIRVLLMMKQMQDVHFMFKISGATGEVARVLKESSLAPNMEPGIIVLGP